MGAKCCFQIFNEFILLCCLNFMGQECAGIVPMLATFLCSVYIYWRYFIPLPWRFLMQPELQQGSDRLNCNQKHFLMLHAIKINCIYINEWVASIFSCNLRSDTFRPSIFRHSCQANSVFGGPKFCTGSLMYQLKFFSCTSHLVTMSAMPPVDNNITIYNFIEKPWQALDITMIGVYHVQMWKWMVMIFYATFLEHVEC